MREPVRRLFQPSTSEAPRAPVVEPPTGLESEYQRLILEQLAHMGVQNEVKVEVHSMGRAADGGEVYTGMIRMVAWKRRSAVRLLLGFPLLEHRVARALDGSWLGEVSHFGGLWVRATSEVQTTTALSSVRELVSLYESAEQEPSRFMTRY